jgi:beta-glucosidase
MATARFCALHDIAYLADMPLGASNPDPGRHAVHHVDDETLQRLVDRLTLEEKVRLLTGRDSWSLHPLPSIGLRSIVLSDGPVGVRGTTWDERSPSANFPSPSAVAASWDRSIANRVGQALGDEARRKGVDVVLAPTINLHRTPYGGRHFEAFSEDPILTGEIATAYVRGVQSRGVGATVKHYVANDSETERFTVDVRVSDRALRELYLLAFEEPVVEGPSWLVMSAYNSINGATASENELLTRPLNDEWGFTGVVVSDWTAVRSIESARHPQDLAMPGPDGAWGSQLLEAVRTGDVDEEVIDRKVRRILRLALRVGALDGYTPVVTGNADAPEIVAREAATNGMVLLSNRTILPLASPPSIALIGEGARLARIQGGGSATVIPSAVVSPLAGVRARFPQARVEWAHGAVVQSGVADFPAGSFVSPDGDQGLLVRYLDVAGRELQRELRRASSLVWFGTDSPAAAATVVELTFRYTPPHSDGDVTPIGLAGLADYDVVADGVAVASGQLRTNPHDDPATAVLNPPTTSVAVPLTSEVVDLVVRFKPVPGGIPDALALRVGLPPLDRDPEELIAEAVTAAAAADVAVVIVSTSAEVESEGFDRASLRLPGRQDDLVRAVAAANPRTIAIVNAGAPVLLPWRNEVAAILATWFPGQEFGHALADVLSGDVEPGGRLPVTWPADEGTVPVRNVVPTNGKLAYEEGVHIGHRAYLRDDLTPAYPFGHGLGYTSWQLATLYAPAFIGRDDEAAVRVELTNTGTRAGKAAVQLYSRATLPVSRRPTGALARRLRNGSRSSRIRHHRRGSRLLASLRALGRFLAARTGRLPHPRRAVDRGSQSEPDRHRRGNAELTTWLRDPHAARPPT